MESDAALNRHLGERDRDAAQTDIVSTAGNAVRDQALNQPLKFRFGIEVECWRCSNHLTVRPRKIFGSTQRWNTAAEKKNFIAFAPRDGRVVRGIVQDANDSYGRSRQDRRRGCFVVEADIATYDRDT